MDALPFPLVSGDTLHPIRGPAAGLLVARPRLTDRAEVVTAVFRSHAGRRVAWHEGNGAFDVYAAGDGGEVHGVEVKLRQAKFPSDKQAWLNKAFQIDVARTAGVELRPWIEQIVTDEAGRRTWLLVPGLIPQGRAFAARGGRPVSTQLERFVARRLQLKGGAVLLGNVPAGESDGWMAGGAIPARTRRRYRDRLDAVLHDVRMQLMAKQAVKDDLERTEKLSFATVLAYAETDAQLGRKSDLVEWYLRAKRTAEAERQAAEAGRQAVEARAAELRAKSAVTAVTDLARQLAAAYAASDVATATRLQAEIAALADS